MPAFQHSRKAARHSRRQTPVPRLDAPHPRVSPSNHFLESRLKQRLDTDGSILYQDDLEAEGYACGAICLPACSVGAPHIRQRLWFVARSGLADSESGRRTRLAARKQRNPDRSEALARNLSEGSAEDWGGSGTRREALANASGAIPTGERWTNAEMARRSRD